MRNYVALNFARINYNFTGPMDPASASVWITGTSVEDLAGQIDATRTQMGFFNIVDVEDLAIWYFPLDKTNVSRIWNKAVAGFPLAAPIFDASPPKENAQSFQPVKNTPRKGWTDQNGVKREPAPSDGEKKTTPTKFEDPETLLDSLRTFAGALITAGFTNNGPRSLLAQLAVFIGLVAAGLPFDQTKLAFLLQSIESTLTR